MLNSQCIYGFLLVLFSICVSLSVRAEDKAVRVAVSVQGISNEELLSNITAWLGFESGTESQQLDAARIKVLHDAAPVNIAKALEPYGYYRSQVEASLDAGDGRWLASYRVNIGPPILWETSELVIVGTGSNMEQLRGALNNPKIAPGAQLRHQNYEVVKSNVLEFAREQGFLDAVLSRSVLSVNPEKNTARALFTLKTGPRYFFGETRIVGNLKLDESFLRHYLKYQVGNPVSPRAITATQFALSDLDYFENVTITPEKNGQENIFIPILIEVVPRKNRRDNYGIGYGTDTGARFLIGTEFRRLNKQGHKLRAEARVSEKKYELQGEWKVPVGVNPGEFLSFHGSAITDIINEGITTSSYATGLLFSRTIGSWKRNYYIDFTRAITKVDSLNENGTDVDRFIPGQSNLLTPGISLSRVSVDDPIFARRGWSLFLDTHGSVKNKISDLSFIQGHIIARGAYPLGERTRVTLRGEYGATIVADYADLPPTQRFYAGGDQSIRGYGYRDIGERQSDGTVVGGRYLSTASLELERYWSNNIGAAAFWDVGGADDAVLPSLHHGVGLGLRYRAPFGSVQLDLAHPLDRGASPVRLHLGVRVGL